MLNIYFCKRYEEEWSGGLVIIALNETEARQIFFEEEGHYPISLKKLDTIESGILHNDYER